MKFTRATWLFNRSSLPSRPEFSLTVHYTYDHMWQITVNRNSEDSLLIHNFQPWQRLSRNPIKSSTIVLNRYWNIYSFRPQFNQCCMNLPNCFPDGLKCLLLAWKLCPKFLLPKKRISALSLLIKQSYAANTIDNIIVDVNRHCEGALNYANDNLACPPHVEYPTRTDQDLYKLDDLRWRVIWFVHMETTVLFGRAISVGQLQVIVLSDNDVWNKCINTCIQPLLSLYSLWRRRTFA